MELPRGSPPGFRTRPPAPLPLSPLPHWSRTPGVRPPGHGRPVSVGLGSEVPSGHMSHQSQPTGPQVVPGLCPGPQRPEGRPFPVCEPRPPPGPQRPPLRGGVVGGSKGCSGGRLSGLPTVGSQPPHPQPQRRKTSRALRVGVGQPETWMGARSLLALPSATLSLCPHPPANRSCSPGVCCRGWLRVEQILASTRLPTRLLGSCPQGLALLVHPAGGFMSWADPSPLPAGSPRDEWLLPWGTDVLS